MVGGETGMVDWELGVFDDGLVGGTDGSGDGGEGAMSSSSSGMICGDGSDGGSVVMLLHLCCFVERMFDRWACICPLVDAVGFGGHRRSCFVVIFGKVVR